MGNESAVLGKPAVDGAVTASTALLMRQRCNRLTEVVVPVSACEDGDAMDPALSPEVLQRAALSVSAAQRCSRPGDEFDDVATDEQKSNGIGLGLPHARQVCVVVRSR